MFILLGSTNEEQRMITIRTISLLWLRSSLVTGMLISLTFGIGVFLKQPVRRGMPWVNGILIVTLLIGNLYKVRDLLQWFLDQVLAGFGGILGNLGWMNQGYWFSPLSWLNPYRDFSGGIMAAQAFVCVGIGVVGVVIGLKGYEHRRIG